MAWRRCGAERSLQHHRAFLGEARAATKGRAEASGCKPQGETYKKNAGTVRTLSGGEGDRRGRGPGQEEETGNKDGEGWREKERTGAHWVP